MGFNLGKIIVTINFFGHQPSIGEVCISTESLNLCSTGMLQLELPANDRFWTSPPTDWTQRKL